MVSYWLVSKHKADRQATDVGFGKNQLTAEPEVVINHLSWLAWCGFSGSGR